MKALNTWSSSGKNKRAVYSTVRSFCVCVKTVVLSFNLFFPLFLMDKCVWCASGLCFVTTLSRMIVLTQVTVASGGVTVKKTGPIACFAVRVCVVFYLWAACVCVWSVCAGRMRFWRSSWRNMWGRCRCWRERGAKEMTVKHTCTHTHAHTFCMTWDQIFIPWSQTGWSTQRKKVISSLDVPEHLCCLSSAQPTRLSFNDTKQWVMRLLLLSFSLFSCWGMLKGACCVVKPLLRRSRGDNGGPHAG